MAVRDERGRHERAIRSVLAQAYPSDRLEVIVVVGGSSDDTLEVARRLSAEDHRVRVIENSGGSTPVSLNLGFRAARGSVVGRVDGHAWVEPDFVAESVAALERTGADGVGGVTHHVGQGAVGDAIAVAMTSRVGAGNASFRVGGAEAPADTVVFGMYRAELMERVGPFDETLRRNQDDEMNHRIRLAGGRLVFSPRIRSSYVVRSRLPDLWRQYHGYGVFRVHTLLKHRRPGAIRQLAPPALLLVLAAAALAGAASHRPVGRAAAASYAGAVAVGAAAAAHEQRRWALTPVVAAALVTMHVAHGVGFWTEVCRRIARRGSAR
jgi:glycosyltransferase involved in cell wall biosynthesis